MGEEERADYDNDKKTNSSKVDQRTKLHYCNF